MAPIKFFGSLIVAALSFGCFRYAFLLWHGAPHTRLLALSCYASVALGVFLACAAISLSSDDPRFDD